MDEAQWKTNSCIFLGPEGTEIPQPCWTRGWLFRKDGSECWETSFSWKNFVMTWSEEIGRGHRGCLAHHSTTALPSEPTAKSTSPSSFRSSCPWMLHPKYIRPGARSAAAIRWKGTGTIQAGFQQEHPCLPRVCQADSASLLKIPRSKRFC